MTTTTNTTIEDWVETFCRAEWNADNPDELWDQYAKRLPGGANDFRREARIGLRAVIEKHVGPLLVEAYDAGGKDATAYEWGERADHKGPNDYAARILSDLTANGERDVNG